MPTKTNKQTQDTFAKTDLIPQNFGIMSGFSENVPT